MKYFNVTGMSCAACSARVEKAVNKVDGVESCAVNLLTNSLAVEGNVSDEQIISAVVSAGYGAEPKEKPNNAKTLKQKNDSENNFGLRLITSAVFLVALMYVSMGHTMWNWPLPLFFKNNPVAIGLCQLILSGIIMVINQRFFISGYKALFKGSPNMDSLVALGASAAFIYSTCVLFIMTGQQALGNYNAAMENLHGLYFESSGMILTLITVGKMLESYSKGKTTNAIKGLMSLSPKTVTVLKNGKETLMEIDKLRVDDVFIVKSGEIIATDGVVIEGNATVDESALTGESVPVEKQVNSTVYSATLNQSGYLKCVATKTGQDNTLSQIIKMVTDASSTKAPIAKIADKVSGVFVPAVILIAIITFLVWLIVNGQVGYALARGISVLVISCPCALGLATPVAIMVGSGVGAKNGILFKTAAFLEVLGKVKTAVLDKTGTITEGKPAVTNILPESNISEEELLSFAYSLETKSEHPLSKAIVSLCKQNGTECKQVSNFNVVSGNGLTACYNGEEIRAGNYSFVSCNAEISFNLKQKAEDLAKQGKTPLFFSKGKTVLGVIAVADTVKKDSKEAILKLKKMGIKVVMLTGDNKKTANAIAKSVGVDETIAEVLPNGKEQVVRTLKQQDKVLMVGDGINDAPALAVADIGMAIGSGTDIAADSAEVVLMKSKLSDIPLAINLSRKTLKNIKENLFWAFIYNVCGIPLAAGAFIHLFGWEMNPMFGAAAMSLSSFCVVSNALRLNLFNTKSKKIKRRKIKMKTVKISGMMCGHCSGRVKKVLEELPEVKSAKVSHETGTAEIILNSEISDEKIKNVIEKEGYKVI